MIPEFVPEHQLIQALCLGVNKDGTARQHPRKELYKLVTVGQPVNGRRVKLEAHLIAGKYVAPESAVKAFLQATKI